MSTSTIERIEVDDIVRIKFGPHRQKLAQVLTIDGRHITVRVAGGSVLLPLSDVEPE